MIHNLAPPLYARLDSGMAAIIPDGMSFIEAAAVMESFVTGWEALANLGQVVKGETVLVHAAAGNERNPRGSVPRIRHEAEDRPARSAT